MGLSPPKSWPELLEVARRFKEEEGVGRVAIQGDPGAATAVTLFEFVTAGGGNPLTLADEESKRAFEFLTELEPYLASQYVETSFDTANELLIDDQVYLVMNWTFSVKMVVQDAGRDDIKAYSGWKGPNGESHVLGGEVLAIPNGATHPIEATKLMKLLLSKEVQKDLFDRLWWLPVRADAYDDVPDSLDPYLNSILDALGNTGIRPKDPQWTMAEKILDEAFGEIVRDRGPIERLDYYAEKMVRTIPPCYIEYRALDRRARIPSRRSCGATYLPSRSL